MAINGDRRDRSHLIVVCGGQFSEQGDITFSSATKAKPITDADFLKMGQGAGQALDKIAGRGLGELLIEGKDQAGIDAKTF